MSNKTGVLVQLQSRARIQLNIVCTQHVWTCKCLNVVPYTPLEHGLDVLRTLNPQVVGSNPTGGTSQLNSNAFGA